MLLLKGFFRKKSTIVYLIIYTIIMTTIIFSFFLIKHNEKIINDITKKRSYITMTSSKDYYNEIDNIKNVIGIERIISLKKHYFYPFPIVGYRTNQTWKG